VIAEIQQASDTTFRLYDWNRLGPDGNPRPLHIEQSLDAIDYRHGPVQPQRPEIIDGIGLRKERLVACDKFVLERWTLSQPVRIGGDDRCYLICAIDGAATITGDPLGQPLYRGQTALIPANSPALLSPAGTATLLVSFLP
jgi:mannose-6-phosphate isomerase